GARLRVRGARRRPDRSRSELRQGDAARGPFGPFLEGSAFLFRLLDEDTRLEVVRHERAAVPDSGEDFLLRAREERLEFLRPQAESTHRVDSRLQPLRCLLVYTEALVERDREGLRFLRGVKGLRELIGIEESLRA